MGDQRQHLAALDGLRGFAALSVVFFHIGHWLSVPGLAANAGLSVDVFFCLSGYVLAFAYGRRLDDDLTVSRFMLIRVIRLWPMIILASVVSAVYVIFRAHVQHLNVSTSDTVLALALSLLNLPFFNAPGEIGGPQVFPLNGPQYSLFFEVFINLVFALSPAFRRLEGALAIVVGSIVVVALTGIGGDQTANFWSGFPRVAASFFAGVVAFRLMGSSVGRRAAALPFWPLMIAVVGLFYFPRALPEAAKIAWIVTFCPVLIIAASRVRLSDRVRALALFAGALSYPVYAMQYPVFCWVNGTFQTLIGSRAAVAEAPMILLTVLIGAYAALRWWDEPIREALRGAAKPAPRLSETNVS